MLELLTGDPMPANLPEEGCLLYYYSNKAEFVRKMPLFDEWGPHPVGLEGPREIPVFVAPLPAAGAMPAPETGAGRRSLSNDGSAATEEPAPLGAPEVPSPGARGIRP